MKPFAIRRFEQVNKELWILLSLFAIALLLNHVLSSQQMVLGFYVLPTLGSAYFYGRRQATLTALASVLMVVLLIMYGDAFGADRERMMAAGPWYTKWLDVIVWGGSLVITGYMMGTLCERKNAQVQELRDTYHGVLMILRHFMSKDSYTAHHSQRVSAYAATLAAMMELRSDVIEDIKAAAMLHDIGKLDISRDLLYKAAQADQRGIRRDQAARRQRHWIARAGGRLIATRHPHRARAPRQVRRNGLSPDQRRSDPD